MSIRTSLDLHHPSDIHHSSRVLTLGEFFTSDEQCIESISAIGTVFEKILFRLSQLLTGFILVKAITSSCHSSSLNSENQVIVILAIKERHEALFPSESLVDEQVFLIMPHRISEIDIIDSPSMAFKLMDDNPSEILLVHCIV